ncbi:Baculoviral IAP repeat containing [Perkinsus olseni]|nr:Baculoviral IAP repeat containing [Perkinsus olseni]
MFPSSLTQCVGLWSVDDVQTWLEFVNLKREYGEALRAAKVDGAKLIRLTADVDGNVFGSSVSTGVRSLLEEALRPLLEAHRSGASSFPRSLAAKGICDWNVEEVQDWLGYIGLKEKYGPALKAAKVKGLELLYMMSAIPESPFRETGVGPETLARVEEALKKKVQGLQYSPLEAGVVAERSSRLMLGQLENGAVSGEVTLDQLRLCDTFEFRNNLLRCGRSRSGNDVVVFDSTMSRRHFEVEVDSMESDTAFVRDMGSSTGTFIMVPYARVEADDIEDFECEMPARLRLGWRTDVYVCTRVCDEDENRLGISVEVEIGFGEDAGSVFGPFPCRDDGESVSLIAGRDPERCSVVLTDPQVSSVHCEIVWDPANEGMVRIRDFSSTNRTWHRVGHLNSEQDPPPYPIYAGDVIKAGEVAFVLFDRLAWSGVPADLDDQSEAAGDASGASSLVLVPTHLEPPRDLPIRSRHAVSRPRGSRRPPIPTRSGHDCEPATREQAQPDTGRSVRTYHDGPSSVIEGGEGEDGVPQIFPSDIFHARLEMLASQREAHAVPSAPAVPRDTRLRRLDSLFPELAVDRASPLHGVMEAIIDGSDNLENGHMNNGQVKDEDACKVCYERAIDTVLVPCGHFVVCSVCVLRLDDTDKQCPICRTAYQLAQKIFK